MFIENNAAFTCVECGKDVSPHPTSSRNHCNYCLTSLHVDIDPGDRRHNCKGKMPCVGIEVKEGKYILYFQCVVCNTTKKNSAAPDDSEEKLIELAGKPIKETVFTHLSK